MNDEIYLIILYFTNFDIFRFYFDFIFRPAFILRRKPKYFDLIFICPNNKQKARPKKIRQKWNKLLSTTIIIIDTPKIETFLSLIFITPSHITHEVATDGRTLKRRISSKVKVTEKRDEFKCFIEGEQVDDKFFT